jgi:hypothetical protein
MEQNALPGLTRGVLALGQGVKESVTVVTPDATNRGTVLAPVRSRLSNSRQPLSA